MTPRFDESPIQRFNDSAVQRLHYRADGTVSSTTINDMTAKPLTRREMIKGSVAVAAIAFAQYPLSLFGGPEAEEAGVLLPFLDAQPPVKHQTSWQDLTSWYTESNDLYRVSHYNIPALNAEEHVLEISGLVRKPKTLTLAEIKARKRKTVTVTLECGGNGELPVFMGAIGN